MNRIKLLFYRNWPIISIVLLGAYLRLYKINEYLTFLGDEGRDVLIVKRMIVDGKWTLLGPTASVGGFYMGPVYYYFMLPFLWAWHLDPVGPAVMVALFGLGTIYLIYRFCDEVFGRFAAVSAAVLYTLSPVIIAYSRASWNPNVVPFFSMLLLYAAHRVVTRNTWNYLFWIGVIFGIGIQLHYTFLFLFPAVLIWLLYHGHDTLHLRWYLYGAAGFMLGFSPFLAFELRHEFANTRGIVTFIFTGKDTGFSIANFLFNVKDVFFRLFARLLLRIPDGGMFALLTDRGRAFWTFTSWATAAFASISSVLILNSPKITRQMRSGLLLLFTWLGTVLLFFGIYKKTIYDYYFGIFYVIPFILFSAALNRLWVRKTAGKIAAGILLCGLAVFNWQGRPFLFQPNNQLEQTKTIARAVLDKTGGKPFNFALITGGNSDHAYRYFFEIWGKPPVTIENPSADPQRKTVTDQLLVICEDPNCKPLGNSLWEVAGFGRAEIAGSWDVSVLKVYKLIHYTESNNP